jgi:hypothetical protein
MASAETASSTAARTPGAATAWLLQEIRTRLPGREWPS